MGTTAEVMASGGARPAAALDAAFAALARVDDLMSLWKPSELTRLNAHGRARVSPETCAVLAHALEVAAASGGAFDPTVEPLVRASGGLGGPRRTLEAAERRRLLARVGFRRVALNCTSRVVSLVPGTHLDLGGIAKGYAADLALAALRDEGARAGMVDLGSSSLGGFGVPLEIDVRGPDEAGPSWATFRVVDAAVSSSSGRERPGHIVDPRSGAPATGLLGVTVVARSGIEADALSTAVYVLGTEEGLALLIRRRAAGLVLQSDLAGGPEIRATPGFLAAYGLRPAPGVAFSEWASERRSPAPAGRRAGRGLPTRSREAWSRNSPRAANSEKIVPCSNRKPTTLSGAKEGLTKRTSQPEPSSSNAAPKVV